QYTLLEDSQEPGRNSCHFGWPSGPVVSIRGKARVVEGEASNAKLKVRFWPIGREGDYWILELDTEHYAWAVVGEPLRKNGWILSRTEDLDEKLYLDLVQRMQTKHGYDVSKLVRD
ncbi:MAG: lipocalin family protein, partial [Zetaproteobacteria bacterium]|nr:lipocalin family protein [Zetaproteobacteria bacterium]